MFGNLSYIHEPWIIRRDLAKMNVEADDRRALFVEGGCLFRGRWRCHPRPLHRGPVQRFRGVCFAGPPCDRKAGRDRCRGASIGGLEVGFSSRRLPSCARDAAHLSASDGPVRGRFRRLHRRAGNRAKLGEAKSRLSPARRPFEPAPLSLKCGLTRSRPVILRKGFAFHIALSRNNARTAVSVMLASPACLAGQGCSAAFVPARPFRGCWRCLRKEDGRGPGRTPVRKPSLQVLAKGTSPCAS